MRTATLAIEEVLAPISLERPAGEDLGATEEWVKIRAARPNPVDAGDRHIWTPLEKNKANWQLLRELSLAALTRKSKDLRIAIWFTEANVRLHGFAGLRDGLRLIRELLSRFWDNGLFPPVEEGDLELRAGPLGWLNEKLADVASEIPLTQGGEAGDYSLAYYHEALLPKGQISMNDFNAAVEDTALEFLEKNYRDLCEALSELEQLKTACKEHFDSAAPSFANSQEALEEIRDLLYRILENRRSSGKDSGEPGGKSDSASEEPQRAASLPSLDGMTAANGCWAEAEALARSGKIDEALARMSKLAAAEAAGRARFQRKLMLAEICLSTKRDQLAKVILEELADLIDKHQLESWESTDVIGGVWTRLYCCYRNENAGTANPEKANSLFLRLCRLDPWQALRCSEVRN